MKHINIYHTPVTWKNLLHNAGSNSVKVFTSDLYTKNSLHSASPDVVGNLLSSTLFLKHLLNLVQVGVLLGTNISHEN